MLRHFKYIYADLKLSNSSRPLSTLIPNEQTQCNTEMDSTEVCPDFTTLPPDTSSIPPNSPYYLYNIDPALMSKAYMKTVIRYHRKKCLRKLKLKSKEVERAEVREQKQLVCKEDVSTKEVRTKPYKYSLYHPNALPHRIAIDLSYSHLMTALEMKCTVKQLLELLRENSTNPTPIQLHLTSYQGCVQDHVTHQRKRLRHENVHLSPYHLTEVFRREQVVYLSGDSDNVLHSVDPSLVYVIGGLVDSRVNIKGASMQAACEAGVRHARLPLTEVIIQQAPRPLPINHIFSILFKFIRTQSWFYAITSSIPHKKILAVKLKGPHATHSYSPDFPNA